MTVNEAENELRSRACTTGVASWMWNYDVEDGTITLSLTAGKKHASRSVPSDKIFLDEHGMAIPGGDGSHLVKLYEELEAELGVAVKIAGSNRARATMTGDGRVLCSCGAELECDHETGDMPEVCPICGKIIDWSWFTFKEADE